MKCLNPKVIGGLALAGGVVFLVAPGAFSAVLPLLVALACPLGMVFMMRGMSGSQCRTRGNEARHEGQTEVTGAAAPEATAEAEIARLRAEVDQLKAEQAARGEVGPSTETRTGDGRR